MQYYPTPLSIDDTVCFHKEYDKLTGVFSNFHKKSFLFTIPQELISNITNCPSTTIVHSAEQAIMLIKALIYKNEYIFNKILYNTNNGKDCQNFGRELKYDHSIVMFVLTQYGPITHRSPIPIG